MLMIVYILPILNQAQPQIKKCIDFKVTGDGSSSEWKNTDWLIVAQQGNDPARYSTKLRCSIPERVSIFFPAARIKS